VWNCGDFKAIKPIMPLFDPKNRGKEKTFRVTLRVKRQGFFGAQDFFGKVPMTGLYGDKVTYERG
jgi:hypothetical protein